MPANRVTARGLVRLVRHVFALTAFVALETTLHAEVLCTVSPTGALTVGHRFSDHEPFVNLVSNREFGSTVHLLNVDTGAYRAVSVVRFYGATASADPGQRVVTIEVPGVVIRYQFAIQGDDLTCTMDVTNNTVDETIMFTDTQLFPIFFGERPVDGFEPLVGTGQPNYWGGPQNGRSQHEPPVLAALFAGRKLVMGVLSTEQPVAFVCGSTNREEIFGCTTFNASRIAPGQSQQTLITFRFRPETADAWDVAQDIINGWKQQHPFRLTRTAWPDRRPIAAAFLTGSPGSTPHPPTDPRGWFVFSQSPTVGANINDGDITTEQGKRTFRSRMLAEANRIIRHVKLPEVINNVPHPPVDPQGVIVWSIEGEEFPHSVSYIGSPDLAGVLAPELEWKPANPAGDEDLLPTVDAFFKRLRDAGLKVGVTLRPQRFNLAWADAYRAWSAEWWAASESAKPTRNINFSAQPEFVNILRYPQNYIYEMVWQSYEIYASDPGFATVDLDAVPLGQFSSQDPAIDSVFKLMRAKALYAKKRWGCTLFYVDSNVPNADLQSPFQVYDLLRSDPNLSDCLFIPEWPQERTFADAAPYLHGGWRTPQRIRRLFPEAWSVLRLLDTNGPGQLEYMTESVRRGDVVLFAHFDGNHRAFLRQINASLSDTVAPTLQAVRSRKSHD